MSSKNDPTTATCTGPAEPGAGRLRCRRAGRKPEAVGPPNGFALLPWLLMGMGAVSNLVRGETPQPWVGAFGLLVFNSLYVFVVFRAFDKQRREARSTRWVLLAMTVIAVGLAAGYGGTWLVFYPLLALAAGSVLRGRAMGRVMFALTALAAVTAALRDGWDAVGFAYGTFISGMVTAAIMALSETVKELRATREELARTAVERERLRFSRDLHDLLGHTLSVVVVKAEAVRRLAPRDLDAALCQVTDIESVGRQALTEIREAVTGYREGSLTTELDRARSALTAAGIEPVIQQSGPPLTAQQEALLGWVVREAVTNAVRHSAADRCEITVTGSGERVRLAVGDNGRGRPAGPGQPTPGGAAAGGTGLKGLTERLASAGGTLVAGPAPRGGFLVTAELPVEPVPASAGGEGPLAPGGRGRTAEPAAAGQ
ncbi:two-component sensor histidine kinase [Streptomyces sulfonofaciens]|uniref:Two-component sensor histidine kinase n=1 Tax=Streptomyces sulfonofaciens TaxID=68272 RepID=A0A919GHF4_9ACTN|nr:histidine kinase [Streptomyces sulfonofaciens]GHH84512.1 two-component sensor histidine kinase [Streptomyces sulfonofaciens]